MGEDGPEHGPEPVAVPTPAPARFERPPQQGPSNTRMLADDSLPSKPEGREPNEPASPPSKRKKRMDLGRFSGSEAADGVVPAGDDDTGPDERWTKIPRGPGWTMLRACLDRVLLPETDQDAAGPADPAIDKMNVKELSAASFGPACEKWKSLCTELHARAAEVALPTALERAALEELDKRAEQARRLLLGLNNGHPVESCGDIPSVADTLEVLRVTTTMLSKLPAGWMHWCKVPEPEP